MLGRYFILCVGRANDAAIYYYPPPLSSAALPSNRKETYQNPQSSYEAIYYDKSIQNVKEGGGGAGGGAGAGGGGGQMILWFAFFLSNGKWPSIQMKWTRLT